MLVSWLTLDLIVHQSGNIVLKLFSDTSLSCLVSTSSKLNEQRIVSLENLLIGVGEIILASV